MAAKLYDGEEFDYRGHTFRVNFPRDDSAGPPWEECDGHGVVSEWTTRDKAPGERVLATDRHSRRYYDVVASMKIARRDEWDAKPYEVGTKGEQAARAVDADFEYLRRWCNDDWQYVGVVVTLLEDGEDGIEDSLWGIESDATEYLSEVAHELADQIIGRIEVDEPNVQLSEN